MHMIIFGGSRVNGTRYGGSGYAGIRLSETGSKRTRYVGSRYDMTRSKGTRLHGTRYLYFRYLQTVTRYGGCALIGPELAGMAAHAMTSPEVTGPVKVDTAMTGPALPGPDLKGRAMSIPATTGPAVISSDERDQVLRFPL